jgi:phytoene dehydrogenase-like protein
MDVASGPRRASSSVTCADAIVVGSGPNGLAAAVVLAAAGLKVRLYEGAASVGGGCRTEELTLPGFRHDICAAVHPLAAASGFFRRFDLARRGVRLISPEIAYAHPLDGGRVGAAHGSVAETAADLGPDAAAYQRLYGPPTQHLGDVLDTALSSMRSVPRRPLRLAAFGSTALLPASIVSRRFLTEEGRAMFSGVAAHTMLPLDHPMTAGTGLLLGTLAHGAGWPVVEGGSAAVVDSMVDAVLASGGEIVTDHWVRSLHELEPAPAVLLDITPRALVRLAGGRLPANYRRSLSRFRYGAGVCKVDWALSDAVPWTAEACRRTATVHVGGSCEEVARSEAEVAAGRHPSAPFVLVAQPGVVDPSRAPSGRHTLWTYCHVPTGSDLDMTDEIAQQIERFAPGFRDTVMASATLTAAQLEAHNPNYIGGDICAGATDLRQTILRPCARWNPYRTPLKGIYFCSSSTPPGPGVHGRCGELAARSALRDVFGVREPPDLAPRLAAS